MKPYPYQIDGAFRLEGAPRLYLADQMRLGKSVQAIQAAGLAGARKILVLCPASARPVWPAEFAKWWPAPEPADWMVVSYDSLVSSKTLRDQLMQQPWDVVILDEAHRLKSAGAKRTRFAFQIATQAPIVWALSGTPMPNHPGELYTIIRALWPDILVRLGIRDYMGWLNMFCVWYETRYGIKVKHAKNVALLREILYGSETWGKGIMLRRQYEEVFPDLPGLVWSSNPLEPTFGEMKEILIAESADPMARAAIEAGKSSPSMSRLRRLYGLAKAPQVAEILHEELESGQLDKVFVVFQHHDVADILQRELKAHHPWRIDGNTTDAARSDIIAEFNRPGSDVRVLLGQHQACREAISLSGTRHVALVELDWTPDYNFQVASRPRLMSNPEPVFVRTFPLKGTLDDFVDAVNDRKQAMGEQVLTSPGNALD